MGLLDGQPRGKMDRPTAAPAIEVACVLAMETVMPLTLTRHRFSVDDYEQMIEKGILGENDRVELIRGEILDKMAIGDPHTATVKRLNHLFSRLVGDRVTLSIQDPIRLPDSEPEPDVALLRPQADYYASGKPLPPDVFLLIEVADSSLDFDRDVKRPLYAQSGIGEYWIVNLTDDCLEVYRRPQPDGSYGDVQTLRRGDQVEVTALPGLLLPVTDLL
jgi:Uma2 family endonuclease